MYDWSSVGEDAALAFVSAIAMLFVAVAAIRANGLRSLSKMSSHDFVATVALGSILAGTVAGATTIPVGAAALISVLAVQRVIAIARRKGWGEDLADNTPVMLMMGTEILDANLRKTNVTKSDVLAKLREANVTQFEEVHCVVLEATGDVSVLHGSGSFDEGLIDGVRMRA